MNKVIGCFGALLALVQVNVGLAASEGDQVRAAQQAASYTVKVKVRNRNMVTGNQEGGHGSGFVIAITDGKAIVFTNRHVVEKGALDVQSVVVELPVAEGLPATAAGEVLYVSRLYDFAVLMVDLNEAPRAAAVTTAAPLPT